MNKKFLALLLCIVMVLAVLPTAVLAVSGDTAAPQTTEAPTTEAVADILVDEDCTCGSDPHSEECPLYTETSFYDSLMAAQSVEEMYLQILDAMNNAPEKLYALTGPELVALMDRVEVLDPEGDDTDTEDLLATLSMLLGDACPDCGLSGEHASDCPWSQMEALATVSVGHDQGDANNPNGFPANGMLVNGTTYKLVSNIVNCQPLHVPSGATVTIDLNGWMLEGNGTDPVIYVHSVGITDSEGFVTDVSDRGKLVVINNTDSGNSVSGLLNENGVWERCSPAVSTHPMTTGFITNKGTGMGVMVTGEFSMTGGTIIGCQSDNKSVGAAVCGTSTSILSLTDVEICYNRTTRTVTWNDSTGSFNTTGLGFGGVVHIEQDYHGTGASLIATGCNIHDNSSLSRGAGVSGGNISLINCTITNNTAYRGAGVCANQMLSITGCTIKNNSAIDIGGGVCFEAAQTDAVSIIDSTISDNSVTGISGTVQHAGYTVHGSGGGVFSASAATISGSTFEGNTCTNQGGGLYVDRGMTLSNSIVSENTAARGGGIHASGNIVLSGTTKLYKNHAIGGTNSEGTEIVGWGGGIYVSGSGTFTMENTASLVSNDATNNGGGTYCNATLVLTDDALIEGNETEASGGGAYAAKIIMESGTVQNNTAALNGGGLAPTFWIKATGGTIQKNTATNGNGGGICRIDNNPENGEASTVSGCTITNNKAGKAGGGIAVHDKGFTVSSGTTISNNTAGTNGGGIYGQIGKTGATVITVTGESAVVSGNTASGGNGGGIYANTNVNVAVSDSAQITGNTSVTGDGGGIYSISSAVTVTNASVSGNKAPGGVGGGIFLGSGASATVTKSEINGNSALNHGGGFYGGTNTTITVLDGSQVNNNSAKHGGGIYQHNASGGVAGQITVTGSTVSENTATMNGGGIFGQSTVLVDGSSVVSGNEAGDNGGGIYGNNNFSITVDASTISGNHATTGYGGGIYGAENAVITVTDSDVSENEANYQGGGIWSGVGSSVTLDNTQLTTNKTVNHALGDTGTEGSGGGIYASGSVTVTGGSLISANEAAWCGGGIFGNEKASIILEDSSSLSGNISVNNGGGVYTNGTVTVQGGASVSNNQAHSGGGIYAANVVISGTEGQLIEITGNSAASDGGGLTATVSAEISYARIQSNLAKGSGGGVMVACTAEMESCTITNNRAGIFGGGVCVGTTGTLNMNGTLVDGNDAIEMLENTPLNNTNNGRGGGICVIGKAEFTNVTLQNNRALRYGGGLHLCDGGDVIWYSGTIQKNKSLYGGAGGIHAEDATITIKDGLITENEADEVGGGIHINNATLTIEKANITNNTVYAGGGGGIHANLGSVLEIHDGIVISGNKALCENRITAITMDSNAPGAAATVTRGGSIGTGNGGGLCTAGATVNMFGGTITGNTAGGNGGGVAIRNLYYNDAAYDAVFNMISGSVTDNEANGNGGGVYADGKANTPNQTVVVIGVANCTGEGDTHTSTYTELTHPVITGNTAADSGGGLAMDDGATVTVYCGGITGNTTETNNGRGYNVYVAGGTLDLLDSTVGAASAPELVIVGGSLKRDTVDPTIDLYYYETNASATSGMAAKSGVNEYFHLPDAQKYWTGEGIFMGWTFRGPADTDANYVRVTGDYMDVGTVIQAVDSVDGSAGDSAVHMYALWIPENSSITYAGSVIDGVFQDQALTANPGNPTAYTFSEAANNITLTAPVKAGYTFEGWYLYQDEGQNANWGYEPAYSNGKLDPQNLHYFSKSETLNLGSSHFGNITLIPKYIENTVNYSYHIVGPDGVQNFGTIVQGGVKVDSGYTYEIKTATGIAKTVTAEPAHRYKFVGWYSDANCTQLVSEAAALTVTQTDGLFTGGSFYAKFDYYLDDLTIHCNADGYYSGEQNFIYEVWCDGSLVTTVTLKDGESVVIRNLFIGKIYTVKEIQSWSWRFVSGIATASQSVELKVGGSSVSFTSEQQRHIWLTHDTSAWFGKTGNG